MNGKDGKPFKTREGGVMRLEVLIRENTDYVTEKIKENQNNVKLTATADAQGVVTLSLGGRTAWKT